MSPHSKTIHKSNSFPSFSCLEFYDRHFKIRRDNFTNDIGYEVLTVVAMKSFIFWEGCTVELMVEVLFYKPEGCGSKSR
jgi:hypothetical protein